MTFQDIFKSGFLDSFQSFSLADIVISLAAAFFIGLFIFYVYQKTYSGVLYSRSFNVSLVAILLVTTLVICGVTSNVVLSLGMVGALSIVRFRAAIKEPMEIVYLFWAIAAGIVVGAGMIPLAALGSIVIGGILALFANRSLHDGVYLLVVSCATQKAEEAALQLLKDSVKRYVVKAKTVNAGGIELTAELRMKDASTAFVNQMNEISEVENATLVSYNGEYMS